MDAFKDIETYLSATAKTEEHMHQVHQHQPGHQKYGPEDLINAMHQAFGNHHARAVHAKGIILEGKFTPDDHAPSLTKAFHLQGRSSNVIARFSDFTGFPHIADNDAAANPRGLAIKFLMDDGASTDIVAHSYNGFPVSDSDGFRALLLAIAASGPDAVKPTKLDWYLNDHPIAKEFFTSQHTPESYACIRYYGVNAFKFTNQHGISHYIRYQFIPREGEKFLDSEQLKSTGPDYLSNEIRDHIAEHPIFFRLMAQIAEEWDDVEDPSIAWPDARKLIPLGTIELQKLTSNSAELDKSLYFMPNNIPDGIEATDPMVEFRSRAYPISMNERQ